MKTLPETPADSLSEQFKLLADPMRLRILALLGVRAACVCELVDLLPISQSAVSQHLARLRRAGLVTEKRDRQWVIYQRANVPPWLAPLLAQLDLPQAQALRDRPLASACGVLGERP